VHETRCRLHLGGAIIRVITGLLLAILLANVASGCAPNSTEVRARAIAAVEKVGAWKVTATGPDSVFTDWWSAHVPNQRWDATQGGSSTSSAFDGARYYHFGTDATGVGPGLFVYYISYLRQEQPIEVHFSARELTVVLKNYPGRGPLSSLSVLLSSDSYLPIAFLGKSQANGQWIRYSISAVSITTSQLEAAVKEVKMKADSGL
jgi:hypothetical protein